MVMNLEQPQRLVRTLRELEFLLGVNRQELRSLALARSELYKQRDEPKKQHPYPGKRRLAEMAQPVKHRKIENPAKRLKDIQRKILRRILNLFELPDYLFGAVSGRTLTQNSKAHLKHQNATVVSLDISSYYPSVSNDKVYKVWCEVLGCRPSVANLLTKLTTNCRHLPQGAPTSPALANIFLASIYAPVCLASKRQGLTVSVWVDDLFFAGEEARQMIEVVRSVLAKNGLKVSRKKVKIFGSQSEKKIAGTRLGKEEVRATHQKMSELRAAIHRLELGIVPPDEREKYVKNLCGRIAHINSVCPRDGKKIALQAARAGVALRPPTASRPSAIPGTRRSC